MRAGAAGAPGDRRLLNILAVALLLTLAVAAVTVVWRLAAGDALKPALRSVSALEARKLAGPSGLDSWGAMLSAEHRRTQGDPVYAAAMTLDNCKYQYPPSALLLMELLPHPGEHVCSRDSEAGQSDGRWPVKAAIDLSSRLAVLGTLLLTFLLLRLALQGGAPPAPDRRVAPQVLVAAAVGALGLTFYPLVWGHTLGQIQVHLNLAMTAALLAWLAGRPVLTGVLLGLCCLFKPNYAVFGVWALWRREWRLAAALLAVAAAGHGIALARYGLTVHLEYLDFLRGLARVGESFWANQSLTGLLHRWLDPGSALQWADSAFGSSAAPMRMPPAFDWAAGGFPDEVPGLYAVTTVSSLLLLAVAFWPAAVVRDRGWASFGTSPSQPLARALDLGVVMAACTLASPVVWWHHLGVFFPLFALALAAMLGQPGHAQERLGPSLAALALAYLLLGSVLLRPELVFTEAWAGLLGSHGWLGALLLLAMLVRLRARAARISEAPRRSA